MNCPKCGTEMKTKTNVAETGSCIGGVAGLMAMGAGAAKGAAIGSVIPGIGTAIGGLVGGLAAMTASYATGACTGQAIDKLIGHYICPKCHHEINV